MRRFMRQNATSPFQTAPFPTPYKYTISSTSLLESKSTTAPVLAIIPAQTRVQVIDGAEDWYQIIYDYQTGYVPTSALSITEYTWRNTVLRSYPDAQTLSIATVPAKSEVQVLSVTGNWSYVVFNTQKGYIFNDFLTDDGNPPDDYNFTYFTTDMTRFVNENEVKSPTSNLLTTDLENKLTYVFNLASNNTWNLLYTWSCDVGKPTTPTIRGTFYINGRKPYFGSESYRVKYATRILESYYYHSILFTPDGKEILDDTLGAAITHGCIRLAVENAQWIYGNILDSTAVIIN